jgi:hypothetical protein
MTTKLAALIAQMEGFNVPGSLPARQNNPGDLMHAPGETHPADAPNSIGSFSDAATGWAMLERQLTLDSAMTLRQFVETYAPPPSNNTENYLTFLCNGLQLPETTLVGDALKESA